MRGANFGSSPPKERCKSLIFKEQLSAPEWHGS